MGKSSKEGIVVVGDDGKVMALTAAIGQLQEELRVYKAQNGDRQPPSTLAMRA